jgi:hypothetical protein
MKKKALFPLLCCLVAATANAGEWRVWKVQPGETLGEIVWALNQEKPPVDTSRLHVWNPGLGTRVNAGQELVYYVPDPPKPAATAGDVRSATENLGDSIGRKLDTKLQEQQEAQQAALDREKHELFERNAKMSGGVVFVVIASAFFVWRSLRARKTKTQPEATTTNILVEPTTREIQSFIRRYPHLNSFTIRVKLDPEKVLVTGKAEKQKNGSFLFEFPGVAPVGIHGRHNAARESYLLNGAEQVPTVMQSFQPAPAAPIFTKLPDDPTESQVEAFSRATGLNSFPGLVRLPEQGNTLVQGGTFRKDEGGVWVVDYPGITTRIFANRRRSAQEFFFLTLSQHGTDQRERTIIQ